MIDVIFDVLMRIGFWIIVGVLPYLILASLYLWITKKEISTISTITGLLWMALLGAVITQVIPNHGLYLG